MLSDARRRILIPIFAVVALSNPALAADVKFGFLAGMTGQIEEIVPPIADAAQLAYRNINEQGGLLDGNNAVQAVGDTECSGDPAKAVKAAERLIEKEEVVAIVGALCSASTFAAAMNVAVPANVAMISPASTSPVISTAEDSDLVFRTIVSDAYQGEVLARLIKSEGVAAIAITYVNNDYGKGLAYTLEQALPAAGITVSASLAHAEGKTDYGDELKQLAASQAPALLIIGYENGSGGAILREASAAGSFERYFASDGMVSDSLAAELGEALEGKLVMTKPGEPVTPGAARFRELALEAGIDPDAPFVANSYDAAFILALALEKSGIADRAALAGAIRDVASSPGEIILPGEWEKAKRIIAGGGEVNYEGASGPVEFDAAGDVPAVYLHAVVEGGKVVVTGSAE